MGLKKVLASAEERRGCMGEVISFQRFQKETMCGIAGFDLELG
jgi:hypothetical protein